jgi:high-affinity nickel permease
MSKILLFFSATSGAAILGFGFLLGLKHATEADHLAAVSTMVTERRNLWSSALVGGMWGLGHTISLTLAGIFVLVLNFEIGERVETALEFCVGIMLTLLGLNVLKKLVRGGNLIFTLMSTARALTSTRIFTSRGEEHAPQAHHGFRASPRALLIGMVHGMAGSAALMLLVIPTIESKAVGLAYIVVFGIGSIGGMMIMSFLVGLPFTLTALRFNRFNGILRGAAGLMSIGLGLFIVYERGFS